MATFLGSKMQAGVQPRYLADAGGVRVLSTYAWPASGNPALNDIIQMMNIPADASNPSPAGSSAFGPTIFDLALDCDQLDSNGSPTLTLDVGDAGAAQRFIAASNVAQAGGIARITKSACIGYQPDASAFSTYPTASLLNYTIQIKVHAAAATSAAGTIRLLVDYSYDP